MGADLSSTPSWVQRYGPPRRGHMRARVPSWPLSSAVTLIEPAGRTSTMTSRGRIDDRLRAACW
jgi:hypothetical protein